MAVARNINDSIDFYMSHYINIDSLVTEHEKMIDQHASWVLAQISRLDQGRSRYRCWQWLIKWYAADRLITIVRYAKYISYIYPFIVSLIAFNVYSVSKPNFYIPDEIFFIMKFLKNNLRSLSQVFGYIIYSFLCLCFVW